MPSTGPPFRVPRERSSFIGREEGVSLVYPNSGCLSSAYQPLHNSRDDTMKNKNPHLDVVLDSDTVYLKGTGVNVEPAFLAGHIVLTLTEPTSLKEITLQFQGKARLPVPAHESMINNASTLSYLVCNHDWSFLEGDRRHSHTLKAGRHTFPFQLRIGGSLPSSIATYDRCASVTYRLRAQAIRPGKFNSNLCANVPIHLVRSFTPDALEYQQSCEIENTWPEKLMYSIMIPHKAWAAGDAITAVIKLSPMNKGISVDSVTTSLHETVAVFARSGSQHHTRTAASVTHAIVNGKAVPYDDEHSLPSGSSGAARVPWGSSTIEDAQSHSEEDLVGENNDVITSLTLLMPPDIVPTHNDEPIVVSHRIRWVIVIANPDGHMSELRCSLAIHVLDRRLLQEARLHTAATRRLLLGGPEVPPEEEEEINLPSYPSHVRDPVADMGPHDIGGSLGAPAVHTPTPPLTPDGGLTIQGLSFPSGYSTPLEPNPFSHLPHVPESGGSMPLEWINSELLSQRLHRSGLSFHVVDEPIDSDHSRPTSRPGSRRSSQPTSRSASPDHTATGCSSRRNDSHHQSHRNLHGFLKATTKSFTSIAHSHWLSRTGSHGALSDLPDPHARPNRHGRDSQPPSPPQSFSPSAYSAAHSLHPSHPPHSPDPITLPRRSSQPRVGTSPVQVISCTPDSGSGFFPLRDLTEVPDYAAASRGFVGSVPPLTSLQGLPSYEEAAMGSPPSVTAAGRGTGDNSLGGTFGQGQRARSDGDLVSRMASLGWGLSSRT